MADEDEQGSREPRQAGGWDYSNHPLKGGGTQIIAVVVSCVIFILFVGIVGVVWFFLSQHPAGR